MTWRLTTIPADSLTSIWRTVAPLLSPAISRSVGRVNMRQAFEKLREGQYLLWVARQDNDLVVKAAFLTRVAEYPNRRMLVVDFAGGMELQDWMQMATDTFRRFAADTGLDGVEFVGREGWRKPLAALGWKVTGVVMEVNAAGAEGDHV